ncbi:uncharacterized protein LOC117332435 [Pecten maximus]|uniref:uncharacterized protein LOC117332435 n=1 Tax=Pecten maximus TaxID=6579 RepID=UPI001458B40B|nr:uncharacterized protein LOC117332435 [Pecten maximus]XP_033747227.1 uncharacterized protein LOC117332435 [Pecten maximus]
MLFRVNWRVKVPSLYWTLMSFSTSHGAWKWADRLRIRRTTVDDYEGVVSVRSDINRGCDYIPGTYRQLLKHNTGYAGFIDHELVSFMFAAEIDNGCSVVIQSGRIKEEYEGRGIISAMKKHSFHDLSRTATRSVSVTSSPFACDILLQRNARLLCKMERLIFATSRHALKNTQRSPKVDQSSTIPADDAFLKNIFLSSEITSTIFPENRLVIRGTPYELVTSNIERILCLSDQILVSKDYGTGSANLISFGSTWRSNHTDVVFINLFGESVDDKIIFEHVHRHVAGKTSSCEDKIIMYIVCTKQQHEETVKRVLKKHSWELLVVHDLYAIEESYSWMN